MQSLTQNKPSWVSRNKHYIAGALLLIHWLFATWGVSNKSLTQDEGLHLVSGYSYWELNDYRLQPENGNLPQRWGGLFAWLSSANFVDLEAPVWKQSELHLLGTQFLFTLGNDGHRLLFISRCVMALCGVAFCLIVYLWACQLWGPWGGLFSLSFAAFNPDLLAHGPLITSDVFFSMALLLYCFTSWNLLQKITLLRIGLTCFGAALTCLSKFSAIIILPITVAFILLALCSKTSLFIDLRAYKKEFKDKQGKFIALALLFISIAIVTWGCIWGAYGFRFSAFQSPNSQFSQRYTAVELEPGIVDTVLDTCTDYKIFPEAYTVGFKFTYAYSKNRLSYFWGERSSEGWISFFPTSFLVKSQLMLLMVSLAAVLIYLLKLLRKKTSPLKTLPLVIPFTLFWLMVLNADLNIGHRHILPVYGFLLVFIGCIGQSLYLIKMMWARWLVAVIPCFACLEVIAVHPNYLTFFNQLVGGPANGYKFFVDSSLDWGQDLPPLQEWLTDPENAIEATTPVYVAHFSPASIKHYSIPAVEIFGYGGDTETFALPELKAGYYAISATVLMGPYIQITSPWTDEHERLWQKTVAEMKTKAAFLHGPDAKDPVLLQALDAHFWTQTFHLYRLMRLEKLRLYLLEQIPAFTLNNTFFIYQLNDAQLEAAGLKNIPCFPQNLNLKQP